MMAQISMGRVGHVRIFTVAFRFTESVCLTGTLSALRGSAQTFLLFLFFPIELTRCRLLQITDPRSRLALGIQFALLLARCCMDPSLGHSARFIMIQGLNFRHGFAFHILVFPLRYRTLSTCTYVYTIVISVKNSTVQSCHPL